MAENHNNNADEEKRQDQQDDNSKNEDNGKGNGKGEGETRKRPGKKPLIILGIVVVIMVIGAIIWWFMTRNLETTDDAFIEGDAVTVAPKVAGYVTELRVKDNQRVKKGDLLFRIDPRPYQAMLDDAKARLTNLDAQIDHVVINDVQGATFFARLTLRQHDRLIDLDARPSDALALAVRQKAPIYIEEDVLERASFPYVLRRTEPEASEAELSEFKKFLEGLAPEDFEG